MIRCPHCNQPGISPLRKAIMSPGLLATCKSCNGESGIRYSSWLPAMIPGSILMLSSMFVESVPLEWGLNIAGLLLMIVIPLFFTPLQKEHRQGNPD